MAAEIRIDRVQLPQRLRGFVPIPELPIHDREPLLGPEVGHEGEPIPARMA